MNAHGRGGLSEASWESSSYSIFWTLSEDECSTSSPGSETHSQAGRALYFAGTTEDGVQRHLQIFSGSALLKKA